MNESRLFFRTGVNTLPPELLLKVLRLLPLRDLKSAVLVNREWNAVGENPELWRLAIVKINTKKDVEMISIGRLARLQEIQITWGNFAKADWELFFLKLEKLLELKNIWRFWGRDLRAVDSGLLARVFIGVENVQLQNTRLTSLQITCLFNILAMNILALRGPKIKKLGLSGHDLSAVPLDDLIVSFNKLESIDLSDSLLSTEKLTSVLRYIVSGNSNLKELNLSTNDMSSVAAEDLATVVSSLERVRLIDTELNAGQLTSIVKSIVNKGKDIKLKELSVAGNDLSGVAEDCLARAVSKVETVSLLCTSLTVGQLTSIMRIIVDEDEDRNTKLKRLWVFTKDISGVEEDLVKRAKNKMSQSGGFIY